jgi:iron-sulfur cluster repair protein YtfE (RIC family)
MKPAPSFASLSKVHDELDRLFESHQRALLASDIDAALALLAKFVMELGNHIDFEERRLLPLYADQGGETAGATLEIFQAEHRKLRESIEKLTRQTESLYTSPDLQGDILGLLNDEAGFKGILHHHVAREQKQLFPRLDERTTEEERETWLAEYRSPNPA